MYVNPPPKKATRDSKIRALVFRFRDVAVEVARLVLLGQVRRASRSLSLGFADSKFVAFQGLLCTQNCWMAQQIQLIELCQC